MDKIFKSITGVLSLVGIAIVSLAIFVILIPVYVVGLAIFVVLFAVFFILGIFLWIYFLILKRKMKVTKTPYVISIKAKS